MTGSPDTTCCYLPSCTALKVLEQMLSPLWNELLVFDQLIVDGRREHLQDEPPLVIINVFDHNKFVSVTWGPPRFPPPRTLLSSSRCALPGFLSLFYFCFHCSALRRAPMCSWEGRWPPRG